jgi:hypothetical protein
MTTSTSTKLTNRIALEYAIKLVRNDDSWCDKYDPDEVINKLESMIDALDKRASTPRKPTKTQIENEAYKAAIVEYLTASDSLKSIKEMQAEITGFAELSNQRITHMLTDLRKAGIVARTYNKKVPYFAIGREEGIEEGE